MPKKITIPDFHISSKVRQKTFEKKMVDDWLARDQYMTMDDGSKWYCTTEGGGKKGRGKKYIWQAMNGADLLWLVQAIESRGQFWFFRMSKDSKKTTSRLEQLFSKYPEEAPQFWLSVQKAMRFVARSELSRARLLLIQFQLSKKNESVSVKGLHEFAGEAGLSPFTDDAIEEAIRAEKDSGKRAVEFPD